MKACMGVSGLGGRDTCMYSSSLLASVSKHRTNATLSWRRLDSGEKKFGWDASTGLLIFRYVLALRHYLTCLAQDRPQIPNAWRKTHQHGPDSLQSISLCQGNCIFLLPLRRTLNYIWKTKRQSDIKHFIQDKPNSTTWFAPKNTSQSQDNEISTYLFIWQYPPKKLVIVYRCLNNGTIIFFTHNKIACCHSYHCLHFSITGRFGYTTI